MKCRSSLALLTSIAGCLAFAASAAHAYTINTTETGKRIRWAVGTVRMQVDPEFEAFLGPGEARSALEMSFDAWRGLPRVPDMVIVPGKPVSPGHHDDRETNGTYLLRDWPYEAAKLAVTVVTYEMDTGRLLDADILVNGQANYALLDEPVRPGPSYYDLAGVLAHEAGHVLGLGESDSGEDATMWPYAMPDDTGKRTLAQDDEDGAIESYLSAPPAASGCGWNSVGGRVSGRSGFALCIGMFAVLGVWRVTQRRRRQLTVVTVLVLCTLAVGFDDPSAGENTQQRLRALEHWMHAATRDDLATLQALESSQDEEIARRAHVALGLARARPSAARVQASTPDATRRLARLFRSSTRVHVGRVQRMGTIERAGLWFTDYQVRSETGEIRSLRVAGGTRGNIEQRVTDIEPPPADAQEVVVAEQADGSQRWAYHQRGLVFGGDLGDGPAIAGAL